MNILRARNAFGGRHSGMRRALLCGAALSGLAAMPSAAFAQDQSDGASASANDDNVIIVQARRQNETLQEVPVTITSVSGETLNNYVTNNVAALVTRVPSLTVQVGGSGSGGQLSLRGVGSSNISAAFDSAVAFDFDGVQVSTMRLVQAGFFDVQQVDVLKGPQALYFGKSATAGVFCAPVGQPDQELGSRRHRQLRVRGAGLPRQRLRFGSADPEPRDPRRGTVQRHQPLHPAAGQPAVGEWSLSWPGEPDRPHHPRVGADLGLRRQPQGAVHPHRG